MTEPPRAVSNADMNLRLGVFGLAISFAACHERAPEPSRVAVTRRALDPADCARRTLAASEYLFCTEPRAYDAASRACAEAGMALVSIDDAAENTFVTTHAAAGAYVGLTDRAREGVWRWEADRTLSWCGDAEGRAENAAAFTRWDTASPQSSDCTALSAAGRDYWICDDRVTWAEADALCRSAGFQLASVSSADENALLAAAIRRKSWLGEPTSSHSNWRSGSPHPGPGTTASR